MGMRKALKAIGDVLHSGKAWIIISDELPGGYWESVHLINWKESLINQGYTVEEVMIEEDQLPTSARRWTHNTWLVDID
jgi:hypothetical protein